MSTPYQIGRAALAAAVTILLCGCSVRPRPEDATLTIYPVMHGSSETNRELDVAIEIRNVSRHSVTFIAPQEASLCGEDQPGYLFAITNEHGRTFPPCTIFYDPPEVVYDESTVVTLGPGESLYALERPYGISGTPKLSMSLAYSCSETAELPLRRGGKAAGWPGNVFVGTLESPVVAADMSLPLPGEDPFVIPGPDNSGEKIWGATEHQLRVRLYAFAWKYQEWSSCVGSVSVKGKTADIGSVNGWAMAVNWYDVSGKRVPVYQYSQPYWYPGSLPRVDARLYDGTCFFHDMPIGFQKKAGRYRVSVDLLLKGKRMATSNFMNIEIVPNPLLAVPATNAADPH